MMQPRVLIVQTFYPEFLKETYARDPELKDLDFASQCERLFGSAFGTGDAYSHGLRALGCEALEVICNADPAQTRWARDHALVLQGNIHDQRRQIVAAQAEAFNPQVIYVFEWSPLGDEFVASLRRPGRLVVGEIASPLPPDRTFGGYDLMISSWPPMVEYFRGQGIDSEFIRLGFDRRILDRIGPAQPKYDVTFVGGFAPSHPDRIPWLEELLRHVEVDIFCYGLERTSPDSPIRKHFRGQAWGWDMYRVLRQSRVTLNRHARLDVRGFVSTEWCNNMRMYEATGVGACLLTEWRPHLHDLFVPDSEVATYRDTDECVGKIRHLLGDENKRTAIARAGQERTLHEHLYTNRMAELLDIFRRRLETSFRTRSGSDGRGEVRSSKFDVRSDGALRIGVVPTFKRHDGGIYQYSATFLDQLHAISTHADSPWEHEFVVFAHDTENPVLQRLAGFRWSVKPFRPPGSPAPVIDLNVTPDVDSPLEQSDMRAWFEECGIDLMIYPSPHRLSFEAGIPFVMAVHDLQHVLQPEFPEVSADGEWRRREYVLRNAARRAALLIAESVTGRADILAAYGRHGLRAERVKVLPYLPSPTLDLEAARRHLLSLRVRHRLPPRYLFYPAQFWPHKNHLRLIDALGRLRKTHDLEIPLVLVGSDKGTIREMLAAELRARCEALGLADQVRILGYVSDEDVTGLYAGAVALVMPTFFGPTNIPFLEAWALGCPVLTSRIRGITEQVGDAGLLVDPTSVHSIADGIRRLWTNEALRQELIASGRTRLASYTPDDFRRLLAGIVDQAAALVKSNPSNQLACAGAAG